MTRKWEDRWSEWVGGKWRDKKKVGSWMEAEMGVAQGTGASTGLLGAGNRSVEELGTLQVLRQEVCRAHPLQAAEGHHAYRGLSRGRREEREMEAASHFRKYDKRCNLFHGRNPQYFRDFRWISRRLVQVQWHQGRCV